MRDAGMGTTLHEGCWDVDHDDHSLCGIGTMVHGDHSSRGMLACGEADIPDDPSTHNSGHKFRDFLHQTNPPITKRK